MEEAMSITEYLSGLPTVTTTKRVPICLDGNGKLGKAPSLAPSPGSSFCEDADSAEVGWMRTKVTTANIPDSGVGGFIFTANYDGTAKFQIFLGWMTMKIYSRKRRSGTQNDGWDNWKQIAFQS